MSHNNAAKYSRQGTRYISYLESLDMNIYLGRQRWSTTRSEKHCFIELQRSHSISIFKLCIVHDTVLRSEGSCDGCFSAPFASPENFWNRQIDYRFNAASLYQAIPLVYIAELANLPSPPPYLPLVKHLASVQPAHKDKLLTDSVKTFTSSSFSSPLTSLSSISFSSTVSTTPRSCTSTTLSSLKLAAITSLSFFS